MSTNPIAYGPFHPNDRIPHGVFRFLIEHPEMWKKEKMTIKMSDFIAGRECSKHRQPPGKICLLNWTWNNIKIMIHEFWKRESLREGNLHGIKYSKNRRALISNTQPEQEKTCYPICVNIQTRKVRTIQTHILEQWNSNKNHSFFFLLLLLSWSIMLSHTLFLLLSLMRYIEGKKRWIVTGREQLCNIYPTFWWHFFNTSHLFHIMHSLQTLSFSPRFRYTDINIVDSKNLQPVLTTTTISIIIGMQVRQNKNRNFQTEQRNSFRYSNLNRFLPFLFRFFSSSEEIYRSACGKNEYACESMYTLHTNRK